jgi:hypothetical protein
MRVSLVTSAPAWFPIDTQHFPLLFALSSEYPTTFSQKALLTHLYFYGLGCQNLRGTDYWQLVFSASFLLAIHLSTGKCWNCYCVPWQEYVREETQANLSLYSGDDKNWEEWVWS